MYSNLTGEIYLEPLLQRTYEASISSIRANRISFGCKGVLFV